MAGHQYRLEKAASFYRRLTTTYWTLCREKDTPLTMEWEDDPDIHANERDPALKDAYLHLQPEFLQFCMYTSYGLLPDTILTVNK